MEVRLAFAVDYRDQPGRMLAVLERGVRQATGAAEGKHGLSGEYL